jgi:hypothetical protein
MTDILNTVISKPGTFCGSAFALRRPLAESPIPPDMTAKKYVERTSKAREASRNGAIDVTIQLSTDAGRSWIDAVTFDKDASEVNVATSLKGRQSRGKSSTGRAEVSAAREGLYHKTWWRAKYTVAGAFDNTSLRVVVTGDGSIGGWWLE